MEEHSEIVQENIHTSFYEEETRDMLGIPPTWMTKWGNTLIFIIVSSIVIVLFNVTYPRVLNGYLAIDAQNSLLPISATSDGYVYEWMVKDRATIYKNQPIFKFISKLDTQYFKANIDGVAIHSNHQMEKKRLRKGEVIMYMKPKIVENRGRMIVEKKYIKDIKIGQKAIISTGIFGGDKFEGTVSGIQYDTINRTCSLDIDFKNIKNNSHLLFIDTMLASIVLDNRKLIDKLFQK